MPKPFKLLIAYDGSKIADAALFDLKLAGLPTNCEAKVLSVADLWIPPADLATGMADGWYAQAFATAREQAKASMEEAKTLALKGQAYLKAEFPKWKVTVEAAVDHPANGILAASEKFKPDLIVMGSHGYGPLGRLLLGSVSTKVLNHAHGSVRIGRRQGKLPTAPKLLVGVDGSRDSLAAIHAIAERPWPKGTSVHLLVVVDEKMQMAGAALTKIPKAPKASKASKADKGYIAQGWLLAMMEKAEATLARQGLRVTATALPGDARITLIKEAKRLKPHCIFLGSRGLNALERFFLGSVSSDLVVRAPCTVEIVRPGFTR